MNRPSCEEPTTPRNTDTDHEGLHAPQILLYCILTKKLGLILGGDIKLFQPDNVRCHAFYQRHASCLWSLYSTLFIYLRLLTYPWGGVNFKCKYERVNPGSQYWSQGSLPPLDDWKQSPWHRACSTQNWFSALDISSTTRQSYLLKTTIRRLPRNGNSWWKNKRVFSLSHKRAEQQANPNNLEDFTQAERCEGGETGAGGRRGVWQLAVRHAG